MLGILALLFLPRTAEGLEPHDFLGSKCRALLGPHPETGEGMARLPSLRLH
jgi:hypothetical protein